MKAPRILPFMIAVILLTAAGALVYHSYIAEPEIDVPEEMILFSIDGLNPPKTPLPDPFKFPEYPVLGQITISDKSERKKIVELLNQGISNQDAKPANCFMPRHALRTVTNGYVKEYVICFQCSQIAIHEDNQRRVVTTGSVLKPALNEILIDAKIPRPLNPLLKVDNDDDKTE